MRRELQKKKSPALSCVSVYIHMLKITSEVYESDFFPLPFNGVQFSETAWTTPCIFLGKVFLEVVCHCFFKALILVTHLSLDNQNKFPWGTFHVLKLQVLSSNFKSNFSHRGRRVWLALISKLHQRALLFAHITDAARRRLTWQMKANACRPTHLEQWRNLIINSLMKFNPREVALYA